MTRHRLISLLLAATMCTALASCVTEDVPDNTPLGNFDALWQTMDRHYCFFDEKRELYGVDWDSVRNAYRPLVTPKITSIQLFKICGDMLSLLRDGHVNLTSSHNVARYWGWYENYPENFSDSILRNYLGTDYYIAAGMSYRVLPGNVGYLSVPTFENAIGSGNLSEIFRTFALCNGLIVDVRNNQGGMITAAEKLASCFVSEKTLVGYMRHKTGPAHDSFSSPEKIYISPQRGSRWLRRVVVLTNRRTFSAANTFVMYVSGLPQVTIVGDRTGGGTGMPFHSELPNGWSVRFSACPMYDAEMRSAESGIDPDIRVDITSDDWQRGRDTIIETAIELLKKK